MSSTEWFFVLIVVVVGIAAIIARYYWARYREDTKSTVDQPVHAKASTIAFIFGVLALFALGKPSMWPVANSILLALIAVIFAFALVEKIQER